LNWLEVNDDSYKTWAARFGEVTERFLVRGADPHFSASAHWEDTCIECDTSNNEDDHVNHTDRRICADFQLGVDQQKLRLYVQPWFRSFTGLQFGQRREITLRSWIEQSGVPNTERLLQLIGDSNREDTTGRSETSEGMQDVLGEQTSERSEISEFDVADRSQPLHARINHAQIAMLAIGMYNTTGLPIQPALLREALCTDNKPPLGFLLGIVTTMFWSAGSG
jgi:hypothetical protein